MRRTAALFILLCLLAGCAGAGVQQAEGTALLSQSATESVSSSGGVSDTSAESSVSESVSESSSQSAPESEGAAESASEASTESSSESESPAVAGISLSAQSVRPGEFIVVTAKNIQSGFTFTDMFGVTRELLPAGEAHACIVPVRASCEPGDYTLTINAGGAAFSAVVTVTKRDFVYQSIEFEDEVVDSTLNSQTANAEFDRVAGSLYYTKQAQKLWEGAFALPLRSKYTETSSFGMVRTYTYTNGSQTNRHMGIDMAAPEGTPVYASNSGLVIYSGFLQYTGNTVVIEHGYGLKTWYFHMSERAVSAGDSVEKGAEIGALGTTGFSTGPHLHFAASVYDIFTDPYALMSAEIPLS